MKHQITIDIENDALASYSSEYLAMCWHVAQHNPAPFGDHLAGELTEQIGREIIRRWLRDVRPELWHHQARDSYWNELKRFAKYEPGGPADDPVAFHSGRWVLRPDAASATTAAGEDTPGDVHDGGETV